MGLDETLTKKIVQRILAAVSPDKIILFGSAASGAMTRDSDIDLLIVEGNPPDTHEESVKIRRALGNIGYPIDVLVISTERFEETKNIFGGIAWPAHKHGKILYDAA